MKEKIRLGTEAGDCALAGPLLPWSDKPVPRNEAITSGLPTTREPFRVMDKCVLKAS
jgi:hypothetical protein